MDESSLYLRIKQILSILYQDLYEENPPKKPPIILKDSTQKPPPSPSTDPPQTKPGSNKEPTPGSKNTPTDNNLSIQDRLLLEKNHPLLQKLKKIEEGTPSFPRKVFIIPDEGLSKNQKTHQDILDWLHKNNILAYNPSQEIKELQKSLHP